MNVGQHQAFLTRCLSIDLEVDPMAANVFALAAVWCDDRLPLVFSKGVRAPDLDQLQVAMTRADLPLGHNILSHDLPHLVALRPELSADSATDDTRIKTAVSWLEEAKLATAQITVAHRNALLAIVRHLIQASPDEGVSTDALCGVSGLTPGALNKAMVNLETFGIARNDMARKAFVHVGVADASSGRLSKASALERDLIACMQELAPEADAQTPQPLNLPAACTALRERGRRCAPRPDRHPAARHGAGWSRP